MNYGSVKKIQKINTPPVNLLFRFFQTKTVVEIWFYDNKESRFEGKIIVNFINIQGFDEYMNLTLDDAYDV